MCNSGQCGMCGECCRSSVGLINPLIFTREKSPEKPVFFPSVICGSRLDQEIGWVKKKMKEENTDHERRIQNIETQIQQIKSMNVTHDKVEKKEGFVVRGDGDCKENMDPRKYHRLRIDLDNYWERLSRKKFIPPKVTLKQNKLDSLELPPYANAQVGDVYTRIEGTHGCVCDNKHCFDMFYIAEEMEKMANYTSIPMYTKEKNHELCILCIL